MNDLSFEELGPMKVIRSDLGRTRVAVPTNDFWIYLTPVVIWLAATLYFLWMGNPTLASAVYASVTLPVTLVTARTLTKRSLWIDLSPKGLALQRFQDVRIPWTKLDTIEVHRTNHRHLRIDITSGAQRRSWTVVHGDGTRHPTQRHYYALADLIRSRANQHTSTDKDVPDSLRALKEAPKTKNAR